MLESAFVRAIFYGRIKYEDEQAMCIGFGLTNLRFLLRFLKG